MLSNNLKKKVLLLNSSYEPLSVINCKKALIMLITHKVDYIKKSKYSIYSEKLKFSVPEIVKLKSFIFLKHKRISLTRKNIFKRDKNICQYCAKTNVVLTIDHVIPKHKGGNDTWENLVSACKKCNLLKADNLLKDTEMNLLGKPKKPHYLIYMQDYVLNQEYQSWKPYLYMV